MQLARRAVDRGMGAYGNATALKVRVCAAQSLGEAQQSEAIYRQLLALRVNNLSFLALEAALCRGSANDAAYILIGALNSLADRSVAIREMQMDMPVPPAVSAQQQARRELLRAVVFRPDVQAALNPYGRVLKLVPEEVWRPE